MTPPRDEETCLTGQACPGSGESEQREWIDHLLHNVQSVRESADGSPADSSSFVPAGQTSSEYTFLVRLKDLRNDVDLQVRSVERPASLSPDEKILVRRYTETARAHLSFQHPSCVDLYGIVFDENRVIAISELARGRSLDDRNERSDMDLSIAVDGVISLANGFREAARHGAHHLSLTPERVSVDDLSCLRAADPGLRYLLRLHASEWKRECRAFPDWIPPELCENPLSGDQRSDVFLLGRVLRSVFTGPRGAWLTEDEDLLDLADRCLADRPAERLPDVTTFLHRLRAIDPAPVGAESGEEETDQTVAEPRPAPSINPPSSNLETEQTGTADQTAPSPSAADPSSSSEQNKTPATTSDPGIVASSDAETPDVSELIEFARMTAENGDIERAETFCHELEDASEQIQNLLQNRQAKTYLASAEEMMDEQNWDEALEQLRQGFEHAEGDLKSEIREKVETCRKRKIFDVVGDDASGEESRSTKEATETQTPEKPSGTPDSSTSAPSFSPDEHVPEDDTFKTEVIAEIPEVVDWMFPDDNQNKLITLASDGSVRSIDARTGQVELERPGDLDEAFRMKINRPTRQLVIGTRSGLLEERYMSDLSGAERVQLDNDRMLDFDVSGEGSIAVVGDEHGEISLVNLFKGLVSTVIGRAHDSFVSHVRFPPSTQHFASAGGDFNVRYWDGSSRNVLQEYEEHSDRITAMAFSKPGGKYLFTASRDGTTRMWHTERTEHLTCFEMKNGPVLDMILGPDGDTMACRGTDTVQSIDLVRQTVVEEFTDHDSSPELMDVSPSGKLLLTTGENGDVIVRSFPRGQYRNRLALDRSLTHAAFPPDGRAMIFADDQSALIRVEPRNRSRWKA